MQDYEKNANSPSNSEPYSELAWLRKQNAYLLDENRGLRFSAGTLRNQNYAAFIAPYGKEIHANCFSHLASHADYLRRLAQTLDCRIYEENQAVERMENEEIRNELLKLSRIYTDLYQIGFDIINRSVPL
jgi:PP-loop superfamily ATP-utilizing enzyme